jgi:hypothetical protein
MVEWETGDVTTEPFKIISVDVPVTCAIYALINDLLDLPDWSQLKYIAKHEKDMLCMVHQAKLRSFALLLSICIDMKSRVTIIMLYVWTSTMAIQSGRIPSS